MVYPIHHASEEVSGTKRRAAAQMTRKRTRKVYRVLFYR